MNSQVMKKFLLAAPEGQIDPSVLPLIERWDDPPRALQALEVIDECVRNGAASSFVVLGEAIAREGTTYEAISTAATWRT